jgi:hypothetical protein
MEAENEDQVYEKAYDEYKRIQSEYESALSEYHRTHAIPYPKCPYFWEVDNDDIEGNLDDDDIQVDSVDEVE